MLLIAEKRRGCQPRLTGVSSESRFQKNQGVRPVAVKAYVLIVTDPGATKSVYETLRNVQGVVELHEVMGPYDIVVEIEVAQLVDVKTILSKQIRTICGIQSTTSM